MHVSFHRAHERRTHLERVASLEAREPLLCGSLTPLWTMPSQRPSLREGARWQAHRERTQSKQKNKIQRKRQKFGHKLRNFTNSLTHYVLLSFMDSCIYYNIIYIYESSLSSNNYTPQYIFKIIKAQISDASFIVVK